MPQDPHLQLWSILLKLWATTTWVSKLECRVIEHEASGQQLVSTRQEKPAGRKQNHNQRSYTGVLLLLPDVDAEVRMLAKMMNNCSRSSAIVRMRSLWITVLHKPQVVLPRFKTWAASHVTGNGSWSSLSRIFSISKSFLRNPSLIRTISSYATKPRKHFMWTNKPTNLLGFRKMPVENQCKLSELQL